ncbi:cadherin-like beta sandwich domain-containing protein [Leptospira sp. FAT2]|uniref:cadherin-like beta sandwich domain-containing protein n=1 Tax=Leptospira sanjuanensis TaxID=2879643 RepID=UPI001EE91980|nr:cadherin-like beta sandwich domain-containing protein [Leptospira sanjuanensis]MCG6194625.1 cadherin-like beta sandwich domain-containing protein [Leptospira sanjuanensis]
MKRIACTVFLLLSCSFFTNCFLNPLSQAVSETFFPTKEECKNCDQQRAIALAAVFQPRANGIQAFGFDLSASFPLFCISGKCAGGITENQPNSAVTVAVPNATNVSSLKATFLIPENSKLEVGGVQQVSGTTSLDFSNPVIYKFTDENGNSQNYTVTVVRASAGDKVNGTVVLSSLIWTKCSYGQVWRPGFNDCQGKGSEADNYGANLDVAFCGTDDGSCDPYGMSEFQNACYDMQTTLAPPELVSLPFVMRSPTFDNLNTLISCSSFSQGSSCGTSDQCPGNTGSTINTTLFPQTVNGYYWTFSPGGCTSATMQVIQFGGASNTTTHTKSSKGKAIRCVYNLAS